MLHTHPHEHSPDDLGLPDMNVHLAYHQAHPGYSHEHPHERGNHVYDHHPADHLHLQVHHRDGNPRNNRLDNLEIR